MSVYTKLACFAGGALFGSFGVKLLSSKDAKKAYVHVTAAGLRMKDSVMGTVTCLLYTSSVVFAMATETNFCLLITLLLHLIFLLLFNICVQFVYG